MDRPAMSTGKRFVVALTGGVASGKSAVERRFEALGINIYNADVAARAVVVPGSDGLAAVVSAFGEDALDASGQLDRPAMRQRVFSYADERHRLEAILHPRIRAWLREHAAADRGPYCLLSIPLLAEHIGHYRWVDRVLVVDAPETLQIARLIRRDGVDAALAERMLANQASRAQRLKLADDVIDNSGTEAALDAQVAALHARYLELAGA
jgi:dephospho-CoA kinase